jgi:hypothetical protein
MLVGEFSETCQLYTGFQIWEIENINAFFEGNLVLATIFKDHYNITVDELEERRSEIEDTDLKIITTLLKMVDDKSFFVFTLHDENHLELVKMQQLKIMNFGIDINDVKGDKVYVVIMDKKK